MYSKLMLGTKPMQNASKAFNRRSDTHYDFAVATFDQLKCGECATLTCSNMDTPNAKTILFQNFNSVANSVDIYMAAGGFGSWNGCTKNSKDPQIPKAIAPFCKS